MLVFHLIALLAVGALGQGLDVIENFCIRLYHQSIIKNSTLYIDGGIEVFANFTPNGTQNGSSITGYNYYLIAVDLSASWDWKTNISEVAIQKTANPLTGTPPPSLIKGAVYGGAPADPNLYIYGGTLDHWNASFPGFDPTPPSSQYSLWSYDTQSHSWDQYDVSSAAISDRPSAGAYAEAPDQGLAFYLNGEVNEGNSENTDVLGTSSSTQSMSGLIVINTTSQTATNYSTIVMDGGWPRTRGGMVYVDSIGERGILVAVGGISRRVGDNSLQDDQNYIPTDVVDIFDVASISNNNTNVTAPGQGWYKQNTTGDIPEPRGEFCVVVASAPDNSSHNIYLLAGRNHANGSIFDDMYILSLPSFTWTQIYGPGQWPHYGHTCHRAAGNQLLTIGGAPSSGTSGQCDWETKSVAVLDMSSITWGSVYNASRPASDYTIPAKLARTIGTGNATLRQPAAGYSSLELARVFGANASAVASWNRPVSPRGKSKSALVGTVIGAVVGSVLGLLLLGSCAYHWTKRDVFWGFRRQHTQLAGEAPGSETGMSGITPSSTWVVTPSSTFGSGQNGGPGRNAPSPLSEKQVVREKPLPATPSIGALRAPDVDLRRVTY